MCISIGMSTKIRMRIKINEKENQIETKLLPEKYPRRNHQSHPAEMFVTELQKATIVIKIFEIGIRLYTAIRGYFLLCHLIKLQTPRHLILWNSRVPAYVAKVRAII